MAAEMCAEEATDAFQCKWVAGARPHLPFLVSCLIALDAAAAQQNKDSPLCVTLIMGVSMFFAAALRMTRRWVPQQTGLDAPRAATSPESVRKQGVHSLLT